MDLNPQILETINSAIANTLLPSIHNILGTQERGVSTNVVWRRSGLHLHRIFQAENSSKT